MNYEGIPSVNGKSYSIQTNIRTRSSLTGSTITLDKDIISMIKPSIDKKFNKEQDFTTVEICDKEIHDSAKPT